MINYILKDAQDKFCCCWNPICFCELGVHANLCNTSVSVKAELGKIMSSIIATLDKNAINGGHYVLPAMPKDSIFTLFSVHRVYTLLTT
jgi:hypothetical protein